MFNDLIHTEEFQGVSYHDRYRLAQERGVVLDILVVTEPRTTVAARSGIVGLRVPATIGDDGVARAEHYQVYYEGWVNGAMQYEGLDKRGQWKAGVYHAAGRMLTRYPTVAQGVLAVTDVRKIGEFHAANEATIVEDEESLTTWLA